MMNNLIGKTISHYKILELIGQGGMGQVFKAQDTRLLRNVAIKILPTDLMKDEKKRNRFIREAQTASSLNHPNICTVHEIDEYRNKHFIVMELIEGETLRERLESSGPFSEAAMLDIIIKVCDALAAVHNKEIFHRDIKPDNIMVSQQGYIKVLDFGIAKLATDTAEEFAEWKRNEDSVRDLKDMQEKYINNVVSTNLSNLLGTVHYMSPEQAQGLSIDQRSDIFSLGIVIYELITGLRPFDGKSNLAILTQIINDPPEPVKPPEKNISSALQHIIDRCLEKSTDNRYQNIEDLCSELRKIKKVVSEVGLQQPKKSAVHKPERRQVTVMLCSLASTALHSIELDPEEVHEVLPAYQELCIKVISRYDGFIVRNLGNEIMVCYGMPQAHEDDAKRAVHSGLGILEGQRWLSSRYEDEKGIKIVVSIGIHTGMVVTGDMGEKDQHDTLSMVGETPSIAAQLLSLAKPGTLVISTNTYRLVKGFFDCLDLGAHQLKGFSQPTSIHEVLHESAARSRFEKATASTGLTPLVGRRQDVDLLIEHWECAVKGKGHVVVINGEAGIGKSRLVHVLKEHIAKNPKAWLTECQCSPFFKDSAFYPIVDLLEHVTLQFQREDSKEEKLNKLEGFLLQYGFSLSEIVPLLASLLSLPLGKRYSPLNLTPERQKQKTMEFLVKLLQARAAKQPVLFVMEDLHWADPSTIELLNLFIEKEPSASILTLFTFRSEFQPPWSKTAYITQLILKRLPQPQVNRMAELVAGDKALPTEVIHQISTKTDGVPLFVEEMTKVFIESGLLTKDESQYVLSHRLPQLAIPATLKDMLTARLDQLPAAKEVAQLGAVIGREFPYDLLEIVVKLDSQSLQQRLTQLVEAGLVYQHGVPPHSTYIFKHALIQDAAYESLLKSKRRHYHQQIAQMFNEKFPKTAETQPELLAHHYTEAGLFKQAILYWQQAGQQALKRSANLEAISHLNKGLELLKTFPEIPESFQQELGLLTIRGPAFIAIKGYAAPEVEDNYTRAQELCNQIGASIHLFQVLWGLWAFYFVRQDAGKSQKLAEQLLNIAKSAQERDLLIESHLTVGHTNMVLGNYSSALRHHEQGITLYNPHLHHSHAFQFGQDPGIVCMTWAAMDNWYLGYPDRALKRAKAALNLARELAHPHSMAYAPVFAASIHMLRRETKEALKQAETAIALTTEHGFPMFLGMAMIFGGWALVTQGKKEGILQIQKGIDVYKATGAMQGMSWYLSLLSEGYLKNGQFEEGLKVLTEAITIVEESKTRGWEALVYQLKGQLLLAISIENHQEAEGCFFRAIDIAYKQQAKSYELRAAISTSRLWQKQGKQVKAQKLLAPVYNWFTEGFDTGDLKEAKVLLEELS